MNAYRRAGFFGEDFGCSSGGFMIYPASSTDDEADVKDAFFVSRAEALWEHLDKIHMDKMSIKNALWIFTGW